MLLVPGPLLDAGLLYFSRRKYMSYELKKPSFCKNRLGSDKIQFEGRVMQYLWTIIGFNMKGKQCRIHILVMAQGGNLI